MSTASATEGRACMTERLTVAGRRIAAGDWAAGHQIAKRSLECARTGGCSVHRDCAGAADTLIGRLRHELAA
jgi:hypothetical protein